MRRKPILGETDSRYMGTPEQEVIPTERVRVSNRRESLLPTINGLRTSTFRGLLQRCRPDIDVVDRNFLGGTIEHILRLSIGKI